MVTLDETIFDYIRNLLVGTRLGQDVEAAARGRARAGFDPERLEALRRLAPDAPEAEWLESAAAALVRWNGRPAQPIRVPGYLRRNLDLIAGELLLDRCDRAVLQFLLLVGMSPDLEGLIVGYFGREEMQTLCPVMAAATGLTFRSVARIVQTDSPMQSAGVLRVSEGRWNLVDKLELDSRLVELAFRAELRADDILAAFVPTATAGTLDAADYEHLSGEVDLARRILARAVDCREVGVNLLLYGEPGTGKTELARLLAAQIGARLHSVAGDVDDGHCSRSDSGRISQLQLARRLLARRPGTLLLFDEIEDLFDGSLLGFGSGVPRSMTKRAFNEALEENKVPTIWITNRANILSSAIRRRFRYVIGFETPPPRVRRKIWRKMVGDRPGLTADDLDDLAQAYEASPALIANALRTADLVADGPVARRADVEATLRPTLALVAGEGSIAPQSMSWCRYRLEAVNSDADLPRLVECLADWRTSDSGGMSLLLHGPPGTGKSEFVRFLARRTGRRLIERTAADIMSPWVGQTEQNVAAAFRSARGDHAILLFDEVDSFLRTRASAVHSWEITLVNEFLRSLERFPGIVACTTNRACDLDAAALRRFSMRVEFGWLRLDQSRDLFEELCREAGARESGSSHLMDRLAEAGKLSASDFAAVALRARFLDTTPTAEQLIAELAIESRLAKREPRRIGFRSQPNDLYD